MNTFHWNEFFLCLRCVQTNTGMSQSQESGEWVSLRGTFCSDMLYYKALTEMTGLAQDHTVGQLWRVSNDLKLKRTAGRTGL